MFKIPAEMMNQYLANRQEDLEVLRHCLAERTLDGFHRIGHQLSGTAKSFGFPELGKLALRLEDLTGSDLDDVGAILVDEFERWLRKHPRAPSPVDQFQKTT